MMSEWKSGPLNEINLDRGRCCSSYPVLGREVRMLIYLTGGGNNFLKHCIDNIFSSSPNQDAW